MIKIFFAGGGTGGHLFPGWAIAGAALSDKTMNAEVYFICARGASQPPMGRGHLLPICSGNIRKSPFQLILVVTGFFESIGLLLRYRPDILVGLGGYVSGPAVAAALILRVPVILQEQNCIPGLTNRILSLFAAEVETSFPVSAGFPRRARLNFTGNPVRAEIFSASRGPALKRLGLRAERKTVVVFGGSQGAHGINFGMVEILRDLSQKQREWQFLHITGEKDFFAVRQAYENSGIVSKVFKFVEQMGDAYACADIVVARSGGGSIAEITGCGLPAVYVPYPSATEAHQELNARFVSERGAGVVVHQREFKRGKLRNTLIDLMEDDKGRARIASCSERLGRPYAAKEVKQRIGMFANAPG